MLKVNRLSRLATLLENGTAESMGLKFDLGDWSESSSKRGGFLWLQKNICHTAACAVGLACLSGRFGRWLCHKVGLNSISSLAHVFIGTLALLSIWWLVAILFGSGDETSVGFGVATMVLGILLWSYPILTGIGASAMTRLGSRPYVSFHDSLPRSNEPAPPAPPPIPSFNPDVATPTPQSEQPDQRS